MRWVENTVLQLHLQVVLGCHFEGVQRLRNLFWLAPSAFESYFLNDALSYAAVGKVF